MRELILQTIADVWNPLCAGEEPRSRMCGACKLYSSPTCAGCPIKQHFGMKCKHVPEFAAWVAERDSHPTDASIAAAKAWRAKLREVACSK